MRCIYKGHSAAVLLTFNEVLTHYHGYCFTNSSSYSCYFSLNMFDPTLLFDHFNSWFRMQTLTVANIWIFPLVYSQV